MKKDFEIDFIKFNPAPGFQIHADVELGNLMELAPRDAVCTARVEKTGDWYLCRLVLTDKAEPSFATAFGDCPQSALAKGIKLMAEKIRGRKSRRLERVRAVPATKLAAGHA